MERFQELLDENMIYRSMLDFFFLKDLCIFAAFSFPDIIRETIDRGYFWGIGLEFGGMKMCNFLFNFFTCLFIILI